MAEIAVSLTLQVLIPLLRKEANLLGDVHKEFADIKDELESIRAFLKDADRRAAAEGDSCEGVQTWVKQLRELAFHIEDVIDEYMIDMGQQPHHAGWIAASLNKIVRLIKTIKPRHQIASKIKDIKSLVHGIKERRERYSFQTYFEQGSSSNWAAQNVKWYDPRMASLFIEEA